MDITKKNTQYRSRRFGNESGVMLIVVLWILVILIIFAAGIGKRSQVSASLAEYAMGETRAKYMALSGILYAAARINEDSKDEKMSQIDTAYQCGFMINEGVSVEKLFKHIAVPGGYFNIVNSWQRPQDQARYGLSDEESRINLNGVTAADYLVLKFLIMDAGFDEKDAQTISSSVVDWVDRDSIVFNEPHGNEEAREGAAQAVKNAPFQSVYELLLIKGMTPEIFKAIKDHVTVFPQNGPLTLNFNTATPLALRSLARNFAGDRTNTTVSDADSLVEKILRHRRGFDGIDGTSDDRVIEINDLRLGSRENSIMVWMQGYQTRISNFLRLGVSALDEKSSIVYRAEAVLNRQGGNIVYWHRVQ